MDECRDESNIRADSGDLLEDLYRESFAEVHTLLCRILNDQDRAGELAQECYLACLRKRESTRLTRRELRLYLFGVARNLVRREKYRRWIRFRFQGPASAPGTNTSAEPSPADQVYRDEVSVAVRTAVQALPEDLRWTLVLREYQECSYEEISGILAVPIGTVRSRLHRARQILAEQLRPIMKGTGRPQE